MVSVEGRSEGKGEQWWVRRRKSGVGRVVEEGGRVLSREVEQW